jgi:hypothetical protein
VNYPFKLLDEEHIYRYIKGLIIKFERNSGELEKKERGEDAHQFQADYIQR